jgi:hypothetical protein
VNDKKRAAAAALFMAFVGNTAVEMWRFLPGSGEINLNFP